METQLKSAPSKKHRKARITSASSTAAGPLKAKLANAAEVKPIVGAQSELSTFSVERAMLVIEKLRTSATDHHQQFVVQGRKAMLELMSQVYEQYYSANASSNFESFMNNVRSKLKTLDVKPRVNSKDSSLLIRLVFKYFDDKQVSVYGHSINVAYVKNIAPNSFQKFIDDNGGFEGVRKISLDEPKVASGPDKATIALSAITNEPTIITIGADGWKADEKYRVYIAVFNEDDGVIDLKNSMLTKEHLEATLILVNADKERRDNPPKEKKAIDDGINKALLLKAQTQLHAEKETLADLEGKSKAAIAEGDNAKVAELKFFIALSIRAAEKHAKEIKELRDELKSKSE